jgi:carboxyl-terminal processing protease
MSKNARSRRRNAASGDFSEHYWAMRRGLFLLVLLACPAFADDAAEHPTPEFLALPEPERILAVYDAFWDALESHYYDPQLLAAPQWRLLREQEREQAAGETFYGNLYGRIFGGITAKLPESHVGAELPPYPLTMAETPSKKYPLEREHRLTRLLMYGPGFHSTEVRRGNRTYNLVAEVMPNTPAEDAGIRPGWRVVKNVSSLVMDDDAVHFIGEFVPLEGAAAFAWERGELPPVAADQWRTVKIHFDHRPILMRLPVESRQLGNGVRYLRFDTFGDEKFMTPVYRALEDAGSAGLILDLRFNGGGLTTELQKLAGILLHEDAVLGTMQNSRGKELLRAAKPARRFEGPLVLLVGPASGSSSEILAAAVRDYRRGQLVGRMTNGSTLVSQAFPLPDGGSVRVPISDFRTSTDQRIEGVGLTPDIRVMPTLDDVRDGRDAAIERAVALLRATP